MMVVPTVPLQPARILRLSFAAAVLLVAAWAIVGLAGEHRVGDVLGALAEISPSRIGASIVLAFLAYFVLTGYDTLAFRYIGRALPYRWIGPAAFVSYAFGNNAGNNLIGATAVRLRLYTLWGLSVGEIARVAIFCSVGFWFGYLVLSSAVLLAGYAPTIGPLDKLPRTAHYVVATVLLMIVAGYFVLVLLWRKPIGAFRLKLMLPTWRLTLAQITVTLTNLTLVTATLYVLLPPHENLRFIAFLGMVVVALVTGVASQVPGGLGVFEAVMLGMLVDVLPADRVLAVLIAFRAILYVLPFLLAVPLLLVLERAARTGKPVQRE